MFKNTLKRLGAIVMVLALAMSVMAVNAFATDGVDVNSIKIQKTVATDGKTYAPATSFEFSLAVGEAGTYDGNTVYAGVEDGVYFEGENNTRVSSTSITFSAEDGYTNPLTKEAEIKTDVSVFTSKGPGVYHYTVTETNGSYEGITYDTTVRDLYVYVTNGTSGLEVSNVVLVKQAVGGTPATKTQGWTNDYGNTNGKIHKLTITKALDGNQAYREDEFTFTVKIEGATGEEYLVTKDDGTTVVTTLSSGTAATNITLKGGESVIVWGLSETDKFSVSENTNDKGYTASYKLNDGEATATPISAQKAELKDNTVTVTNTKNASTPTGVIMNIAPYVLMVALAGGIAFFFLRRKNAE